MATVYHVATTSMTGTKYKVGALSPTDSNTSVSIDCRQFADCTCVLDNKCNFGQSYGEGSVYRGFWVEETFSLNFPGTERDAFRY